ncbi:MAG TPA: DUF4270 family protein [Saprospiraceae bacterium]|nr:DUF4270 family protein [Saprospiraceae bacterium]
MRYWHSFLLIAVCIFTWSACNDSLDFGTDLLQQGQLEVGSTDTLNLRTTTVSQDSVLVYDPAIKIVDAFLIGTYQDPFFGTTKASAYLQYRLGSTISPDISNATIDSVVLSMVYDTLRNYGDYQHQVSFDVFRIRENMTTTAQVYSNKKYITDNTPVGTTSFVPSPFTSQTFFEYPGGFKDTVTSRQIRIRLDQSIIDDISSAKDSIFNSNDNFQKIFNGFKISSSTINSGISAYSPLDPNSKITVYYTKHGVFPAPDTINQYEFIVSTLSTRTVSFEHDYSTSLVKTYINSGALNDSLVFLQGMAGTQVKIEIPNVESLNKKIINKAELNIYIKNLSGDNPKYTPVSNILIGKKDAAGKLSSVNDVIFAINKGGEAGLATFLGGTVTQEVVNGVSVSKYKLNMSAHLQIMAKSSNPIIDNYIYLTVYRRPENANRVALYGAASKVLAPKLKITYTNLIK